MSGIIECIDKGDWKKVMSVLNMISLPTNNVKENKYYYDKDLLMLYESDASKNTIDIITSRKIFPGQLIMDKKNNVLGIVSKCNIFYKNVHVSNNNESNGIFYDSCGCKGLSSDDIYVTVIKKHEFCKVNHKNQNTKITRLTIDVFDKTNIFSDIDLYISNIYGWLKCVIEHKERCTYKILTSEKVFPLVDFEWNRVRKILAIIDCKITEVQVSSFYTNYGFDIYLPLFNLKNKTIYILDYIN